MRRSETAQQAAGGPIIVRTVNRQKAAEDVGMIFTFWISDGQTDDANEIPQAVTAWRQQYPDMALYSDDGVLPLLAEFGDQVVDLYKRIRIPACKSDVARLLLLYKFGGLYLDCHSGPGDPQRLLEVFKKVADYEVVLFDKTWDHKFENDINLINGVMGARQGSPLVKNLLDKILLNLKNHDARESSAEGYVPYNIAVLSGAWNLRINLFQPDGDGVMLRKVLVNRVHTVCLKRGEDFGIVLYKYYYYRKPGRHWSERQQNERLFLRQGELQEE